MKTIAYAMGEHEIYRKVMPVLLRAVAIWGKDIVRQAASRVISEQGIEDAEKTLLRKTELIAAVEKDTIYFDGVKKIEDEIAEIRRKYPESRIVVFIDDLDRCSPTRALEVFESMKVFLDIEGFVYIVGLSYKTLVKLISAAYKEFGISGDEYVRKIIQIPITMPEWTDSDLRELVRSLSKKLEPHYTSIVAANDDMIVSATNHNPRDVKQFINNFIVTHEIFSRNSKVNSFELIIVQALRTRWSDFYKVLSVDSQFRNILSTYLNCQVDQRQAKLQGLKRATQVVTPQEEMLLNIDSDLWKFLESEKKIIMGIKDWETYRRAVPFAVTAPSELPLEVQTITTTFRIIYYELDNVLTILKDERSTQSSRKRAVDELKRALHDVQLAVRRGRNTWYQYGIGNSVVQDLEKSVLRVQSSVANTLDLLERTN